MNKMFRCIIVDDEPPALALLEEYVRRTPFLALAAKCSSGVEALEVIRNERIDVAFMDIQMPQLNGIELSRLIGDCAVVFTTAFEQYALEGYKVNAKDYLLKPFDYSEFLAAAVKATDYVGLVNTAKNGTNNTLCLRNLVVRSDYRQVVVNPSRITYIEGIRDYIKIHFEKEEPIQTLMSLKSVEELLSKSVFVRVHRSFIVNVDQVKTIERNRIVFGKTYIPISDGYKPQFDALFRSRLITVEE